MNRLASHATSVGFRLSQRTIRKFHDDKAYYDQISKEYQLNSKGEEKRSFEGMMTYAYETEKKQLKSNYRVKMCLVGVLSFLGGIIAGSDACEARVKRNLYNQIMFERTMSNGSNSKKD